MDEQHRQPWLSHSEPLYLLRLLVCTNNTNNTNNKNAPLQLKHFQKYS